LIDDPYFLAIAAVAFLLVGVGKAGFGAGLGSLAIPLMALRVPVAQAATIILPGLMLIDIFALWLYRSRADWTNLRIIIPGGIAGLAIGYFTFRYFDDNGIRLVLGVIAIGLVANAALQSWRRRGAPPVPAQPSWSKGGFWSTASGFTSFIANGGGPALQVYLLPLRLDKSVFTGTNTIFFAIMNYSKTLPFWQLGQFTDQNLLTALALLPVAPFGVWLGFRLHKHLDDKQFYRWVYGFLLFTGIKLVWDGLSAL
jgi:uncharacterized membrane protein YfcA